MSLRLVSDNVSELPIVNLQDFAANLRLLAETVEAGKAEARSAIIVVVREDGLAIHVTGEACSNYELMGLFEAAKLRVFADDMIED